MFFHTFLLKTVKICDKTKQISAKNVNKSKFCIFFIIFLNKMFSIPGRLINKASKSFLSFDVPKILVQKRERE